MLYRANRFGTDYSTNGRHYTLNKEMLAQSCLQLTTNPMLNTEGKIKPLPSSISVTEVRTPDVETHSKVQTSYA